MKFYIDYMDTDGNICHYVTNALTKEEAEDYLYDDVYDIDFIITIRSK